jgi:RsiW-degrading membrane proteinase PrsW (M82 family)
MLESLLGVLLGPVPALALLFFSLKNYESSFEERTLFRLFIWGIFLGLIAVFFEFTFFSLDPRRPMSYQIISIPGLALFQALVKLMVLNRKKFQAKRETTFYGLSLGLGFAAICSFSYSFAAVTPDIKAGAYYSALLVIMITFGNLLLQGAGGAILGCGSTSRKIFKFLGCVVLTYSIFNFVKFITFQNVIRVELSAIIALLYGAVFFVWMAKFILPKALPEELRKKRRRILRAKSR